MQSEESAASARRSLTYLRLAGVQPFVDGNGRSARLIVNLELMESGDAPIHVTFVDQRKYYNALHADHGGVRNATPMVALTGSYVEDA